MLYRTAPVRQLRLQGGSRPIDNSVQTDLGSQEMALDPSADYCTFRVHVAMGHRASVTSPDVANPNYATCSGPPDRGRPRAVGKQSAARSVRAHRD